MGREPGQAQRNDVQRPRTRRFAIAMAAVLGAGLLAPSAIAAPTDEDIQQSQQAEAATRSAIAGLEIELARLSAQRDEAEIRAQQANEAYLQAEEALREARAAADELAEQAANAQAELERQRAQLGRIATAAYRGSPGSLGPIEPLLSADSFENAMRRSLTVDRLGKQADEQVQRFEATQEVATTLQRRADAARAEQEAATQTLAEAAAAAESAAESAATQFALSEEQRAGLIVQLAAQRRTTVELEQQRQAAVEQERIEREQRAARAAAIEASRENSAPSRSRQPAPEPERSTTPAPRPSSSPTSEPEPTTPAPQPSTPAPQPTTPAPRPTTPAPEPTTPAPSPSASPSPSPSPSQPPPPPPPPPSTSAGEQALAWARTQLGKPYIWGATGPHGYDCSGLVQRAFQNAGVSLPRTTGAQYHATARVPVSQLRPGDLIFYSSNGQPSGIRHVAIYAGNGMRLHAPSPGKTVELVPMWWTDVLPYGGRVG